MPTAITENTRACYPIDAIPNHLPSGAGGHPKNIVFLTADAFGVLPPIARLTPSRRCTTSSRATPPRWRAPSAASPSPRHLLRLLRRAVPAAPPGVYAKMLGERIAKHGARVWLVNTGWTGGAYGTGSRMKLGQTRAMLRAALSGALDRGKFAKDPVFGFDVPTAVPEVPDSVLSPRATWADPKAYDAQARKLAQMFRENFEQYRAQVPDAVAKAGPV